MTTTFSTLSAIIVTLALSAPVPTGGAVDGTWQFTMQTDGGPREATVEMKAEGDQVSGTWDTTPLKGSFKEGHLALNFPFTSPEAGLTADLIIDGRLEGDTLQGTWTFSQYSGSFTAARKATP